MSETKTDSSQAQLILALLKSILSEMVTKPDKLKVESNVYTGSVSVSITPAPVDCGRLIGKSAEKYLAICGLMNLVGANHGLRITIGPIVTPHDDDGSTNLRTPWKPKAKWPSERIVRLIGNVAMMAANEPKTIRVEANHEETDSTVEVFLGPNEDLELAEKLESFLQIIFAAIARANGRMLHINVIGS